MPGMPKDPVTPVMEAANSLHELFLAYQEAGFTEDQAFRILLAQVKHHSPEDNQT